MTTTRRKILASLPGFVAWPTVARQAPLALAAYERETGGHVGVHAENRVTGATIAWRPRERFVMCSTFKFSLAALALARADRGSLRLNDMISYGVGDIQEYAPAARRNLARGAMSVAEMCEAAVELSDNTCANLLLAKVGGPASLTAFWRASGDATTRLTDHEPELNRTPPGDPTDATTPAAMAGNLRRFILGNVLSPSSRRLLVSWMVNCKTGADRLRGGLPKDWTVGDKTGNNGADAAGDLAVAWPTPGRAILICAYVQGGRPTPAQVRTVFTEIGRMVARSLA